MNPSDLWLDLAELMFYLVAGLSMIGLGVGVLGRRPLVLPAGHIRLVLLAAIVPEMLLALGSVLVDDVNPLSQPDPLTRLYTVLGIAVTALLAASVFAIVPGGYWLMNITRDIVLGALDSSFDKYGLVPTYRAAKRGISAMHGREVVVVDLEATQSTVVLVLGNIGYARLRIRHKADFPHYKQVVVHFVDTLRSCSCGSSFVVGIPMLLTGLAIVTIAAIGTASRYLG